MEMHIRTTIAALIAAVLVVTLAGNSAAQSAHEIRKGTMVNITTCVVPSLDEDDEFVLTNIVDSPVHPPIAGKVIYWVKEVKKISPYVNKRIQFDARIDDVDRREVEVKRSSLNGNGNGAIVEIELAGNEVKARPDTVGLSTITPPASDNDEIAIRTTTVELDKLTNIRVLGDGCNVGMGTATVAAATTELTTETRTETANVVGTEAFTAETRTEAAAVVETPSVAVTRETEVAVETAPTPAPEVAVESPEPTPSPEIASARTELPATATPLPLVGLIGLASLGAASALRLRRR
jgi:hypothetical protein